MTFMSPYYLVLLLFIPAFRLLQSRQGKGHIYFSAFKGVEPMVSRSLKIRRFLKGMNYVILLLLIIAAGRPQIGIGGATVPSEGIDMAMIIDVSGSMKTVDKPVFNPSFDKGGIGGLSGEHRLSKVKRVSRHFIKSRKGDRVGLVAFAGKSVMISPLTQDYKLLDKQISTLDFNLTSDGTGLGMALASGINMLKDSEHKEKAIIILTDGINNSGDVEPVQAAYMAKNYNVKIYPIEMGSFAENEIMRAQSNWEGSEPQLLPSIARFTGGRHFVIADGDQLYAVYNEIEKAEKSKIDVKGHADHIDIFPHLVIAALLLLIMQTVLLNTRYMKIP